MKKNRFKGTFISTVTGASILAVACASHPFKSGGRYPAGDSPNGTVESVDEAANTPPPISADDEQMTPAKRLLKIAACGSNSLDHDTLSDYPKLPTPMTPYFPGLVRVLSNPHEAVLAKVALIQNAKRSIDISTYIFTPDPSSDTYADELNKALLRGINIRVLVDAGGSAAFAVKDQYNQIRSLLYTEQNELAREAKLKLPRTVGHADVVIFHPLFKLDTLISTARDRLQHHESLDDSTISNFDRRSHDKILVIDKEDPANTYAIVGGRNIDDSYYGVPQIDKDTYNDMELIVKNDESHLGSINLTTTLDHHFTDLFCAKGNRWLATGGEIDTLLSEVDVYLEKKRLSFFHLAPLYDVSGDIADSLHKTLLPSSDLQSIYNTMWNYKGGGQNGGGPVKYFRDDMSSGGIHPANEEENITRTFNQIFRSPDSPDLTYVATGDNADSIYANFFDLVKNAEKSIDILTPYIFLPPNERSCLKAWVMADPTRHVRLLSNSVSTSDSALAMSTFDGETATAMAPQPPRENDAYDCLMDGKHYTGNFVNGPLGSQRIEVYELGRMDNAMFKINGGKGPFYGKLHAKFAVIDYNVPGHGSAWVGSDNLDERSRHLNSETAVFVKSDKIAQDLKVQFDDLAAKSVHYGDADWTKMQAQPEVKTRLEEMSTLDKINARFPAASFGD